MAEPESEAVEPVAAPGAFDAPMIERREPARGAADSQYDAGLPVAADDDGGMMQRRAHAQAGPENQGQGALIMPCSKFAIAINKQDQRFRAQ